MMSLGLGSRKVELLTDCQSLSEALRLFAQAAAYAWHNPLLDHEPDSCGRCGSDFSTRLEGERGQLPDLLGWMEKRISAYPDARKFSVTLAPTPLRETPATKTLSVQLVVWFGPASDIVTHATYWSLCRCGDQFTVCGPKDWTEIVPSGLVPPFPGSTSACDIAENLEEVAAIGVRLEEQRAAAAAIGALEEALEADNMDKIKSVLKDMAVCRVTACRETLDAALLKTIRDGQSIVVGLLLDHGADPGTADREHTALQKTAFFGHREIAGLLLDRGAVVDQTDPTGKTALMMAARQGHTEVMRLLLERGAAVNHRDCEGGSALIEAAWDGQVEAVRLLLANHADVRAQETKTGATALWRTADNDFSPEAKLLDIARLLVNAGADVNARDKSGKTPLQSAERRDRQGLVDLLKRLGARSW